MEPLESPSPAYDATLAVMNALGAFAPPAGAAAAVITQRVQAKFNDRLYNFINDFVEEYNRRDVINEVLDSDEFVSAMALAVHSVRTTHEETKLRALRNCLISALLPGAPGFDEYSHFMRLVDRYSGTHLVLLDHLVNPRKRYPRGLPIGANSTRRRQVEEQFPELAQNPDWCDLIWDDLYDGHLITVDAKSSRTMMTEGGLLGSVGSPMGERFLRLVNGEQQE